MDNSMCAYLIVENQIPLSTAPLGMSASVSIDDMCTFLETLSLDDMNKKHKYSFHFPDRKLALSGSSHCYVMPRRQREQRIVRGYAGLYAFEREGDAPVYEASIAIRNYRSIPETMRALPFALVGYSLAADLLPMLALSAGLGALAMLGGKSSQICMGACVPMYADESVGQIRKSERAMADFCGTRDIPYHPYLVLQLVDHKRNIVESHLPCSVLQRPDVIHYVQTRMEEFHTIGRSVTKH